MRDFAVSNNSKIYSHIQSISKHGQLPSSMFFKDISVSSDLEKANVFNKYFFSVYSSASVYDHPTSTTPPVFLSEIQISSTDVYDVLIKLNPIKAMGIDRIGPNILMLCACALYQPIHHLFTTSLRQCQLPTEWRTHCIVPIFKSGDRSDISNYRPIYPCCVQFQRCSN